MPQNTQHRNTKVIRCYSNHVRTRYIKVASGTRNRHFYARLIRNKTQRLSQNASFKKRITHQIVLFRSLCRCITHRVHISPTHSDYAVSLVVCCLLQLEQQQYDTVISHFSQTTHNSPSQLTFCLTYLTLSKNHSSYFVSGRFDRQYL